MCKMKNLDEQERLIVRELIKDPRISDNQISIKTNVPLKTVNRKRKLLEENNILSYFCSINHSSEGTGTFPARSLFVAILKDGLTRKAISDKIHQTEKSLKFFSKHISFTFLGEYESNVAILSIVESRKHTDLIEIFNAEIIPELELYLGHNCIKKTLVIPLSDTLRLLHNYIPNKNMKKGIIKENWPNDYIFVDD
jgi:DNA-binding Lrp family transcriptional regulator